MKINDVERITGLTQKAIRLYESKGLISVSRDENGYRNYSDKDASDLKKIKMLRSVGASIADIKLYLSGVMVLEEIVDKRKSEIMKESGNNSEMYRLLEKMSEQGLSGGDGSGGFTENEEMTEREHGALSVGIDIGTTTVSAVVYDLDNKEEIEAYSVPHNSYLCSDVFFEQSVSLVIDKAQKLLYHIIDNYTNIISIGITGQMHGIVYIDEDGMPVSELINWQDKRADIPDRLGETACQGILRITGERISTGYGIATHYYNVLNRKVPERAVGFLSIMDLFGMKITGRRSPTVHSSVAASFGLFDIKENRFKTEKLSLIGIGAEFLPEVTGESVIIGKCRGIPIAVAIGDNQASFLGSVDENDSSILVNIGTGSQISLVGDYVEPHGDVELRPLIEGKYLICGSALCGGYAYSMVESFFRSYLVSAGAPEEPQYKIMNELALKAYEKGEAALDVEVCFFGKRSDPNKRGSIKNIGRQNFTPESLILGTLSGMCGELYELYEGFSEKKSKIIASGGAVKRNEVLKELLSDKFGMTVSINSESEEAAKGAALFSAFAVKKIEYNGGFGEFIKLK